MDPTDGVPPAGKAGPQPKVQRAVPSAVAATGVKTKSLEKEKTKKPRKKKTQTKKTLWGGSGFGVRQLGSSTGVSTGTGTGKPFRLSLPKTKRKQNLYCTCESHNDPVVAALSEWTCITGLKLRCLFDFYAGELNYTTTTAPRVILECPGTYPVRQTALAKAAASMEGRPLQETWAAMPPAAQREHLLGSAAVFPLEVEQRLRGDSARALAQGLSALNEDLFKGHVGLSEALAAEVKARSDAKNALAREARTQAQGAQEAAPARRRPLGGVPPPPTVVVGWI